MIILDTDSGQVHAQHDLVPPGEASILDEHYDGPRAAPARAIRPKTVAEKQFCGLGPAAEAFIAGAAAAGHTRLGPELAELNTLAAAHGTEAFIAALQRATAFRRFKAADVRSILAAGAGTPQPRPAGQALVIDLPIPTGRSLAEYTPDTSTPSTGSNPDNDSPNETGSEAKPIGPQCDPYSPGDADGIGEAVS